MGHTTETMTAIFSGIYAMLEDGKKVKEIAESYKVAEGTIRAYLARMRREYGRDLPGDGARKIKPKLEEYRARSWWDRPPTEAQIQRDIAIGNRCKCRLLTPCYQCTPTAVDVVKRENL